MNILSRAEIGLTIGLPLPTLLMNEFFVDQGLIHDCHQTAQIILGTFLGTFSSRMITKSPPLAKEP